MWQKHQKGFDAQTKVQKLENMKILRSPRAKTCVKEFPRTFRYSFHNFLRFLTVSHIFNFQYHIFLGETKNQFAANKFCFK